MITLRSQSIDQTHEIATAIAGLVRARDLIVLAGEMGAGKTAFTVGFARAMGVHGDEHVSSPTFTLVHTYETGRLPIHHADLYRLNSLGEVADLGLREQVDLGAVGIVEWGNVAGDVLGDVLTLHFEHDLENDNARTVTVSVTGHQWDTRWERLREALRPWSVAS
jgi:tRNA threonylcarbamoyladenosine biosynthesis protein TsaE